jgi:hypothetical protein
VLEQGEYFVALLLVGVFILLGIFSLYGWQLPTERKWISRVTKIAAGVLLGVIGLYSTGIILQKKDDKPWTSLPFRQAAQSPTPAFPSRSLAPALEGFRTEPSVGREKSMPYYSNYPLKKNVLISVKIGHREVFAIPPFRYIVAAISSPQPTSLILESCQFLIDKFDVIKEAMIKDLNEDPLYTVGQRIQWQRRLVVYHTGELSDLQKLFLEKYAEKQSISLRLEGPISKPSPLLMLRFGSELLSEDGSRFRPPSRKNLYHDPLSDTSLNTYQSS